MECPRVSWILNILDRIGRRGEGNWCKDLFANQVRRAIAANLKITFPGIVAPDTVAGTVLSYCTTLLQLKV